MDETCDANPKSRYYRNLPQAFETATWSEVRNTQRRSETPDAFRTTDWKQVKAGACGAAEALEVLVRAYWYPLKSYALARLRREADAEDAVQSFMLRLTDSAWLAKADPAKGKFRAFMLTSFRNLIIDLLRKQRPELFLPMTEAMARSMTDSNSAAPDAAYESQFYRDWAITLVDLAMQRLEQMENAVGRGAFFLQLRPHMSDPRDLAGLAQRLSVPLGTVKVTLQRHKDKLRKLTREEVRRTLDNPTEEEVTSEMRFISENL